MNNTQTIRELNDRFRQGDETVPGEIVITSGLVDLLNHQQVSQHQLIALVQQYDDFDTGNDPYGEHDFGSLDFLEQKCFWKIDYYDLSLSSGSEDPSDLTITKRVLTIMLASEY